MSGNHLTVPGQTFTSINTGSGAGDGDGTATGRPRSSSIRSTVSQRSRASGSGSLVEGDTEERDYTRRPSIRIAHQPSQVSLRDGGEATGQQQTGGGFFGFGNLTAPLVGRNRSNSEPTRRGQPSVAPPKSTRQQTYMPDIQETTSGGSESQQDDIQPSRPAGNEGSNAPRLRHAKTNIHEQRSAGERDGEYENQLVDFLDVVDPEVSTLTTLTNVQNSLFVPDLGKYLNRRPTYILTRRPSRIPDDASSTDEEGEPLERSETAQTRPPAERTPTSATLNTITSRVQDRFYAVLPHGVQLKGWSEEDKLELNDHVRHMLHSRRSKFKRSMRGFGQYVRKPLGFFVTLYAVLITLFGLAWVLFLIGWINVGGRKDYIVNVIDNVLVALFAIVGDGLAPFRAVDTYHMCFIAHYHHLTWRLRREQSLPALQNPSDLPPIHPTTTPTDPSTLEKGLPQKEYSVLTPAQQAKLEHHQSKFSKSHSFYKPHETYTHNAFSLRLLVAVVVLLDCHSLLQIALGTCTWAISYHVRPFALTTVILCCSITVNITAGVLISIGDHRSRKKDVIERLFRQQLTEEAMRKVERRREREVRRTLEARGLGGEIKEEEVKRFVSPPPVVMERSSLEVRRELEVRKVLRDGGANDKGDGCDEEMRMYVSPPLPVAGSSLVEGVKRGGS